MEKEKLFTEIFKENKERIYRLCYASLSNKGDLDDLFQEVMMNVWRNLENFRNEAKVSTWIYRITINTALLYNKRYTRNVQRFPSVDSYQIDATHSSEEFHIQNMNEDLKKLHNAIAALKKQDRLIIGLYLEDMSYDEISEIVGISVNYVGVKINRIKSIIAKIMGGN